MDFIKTRLVPVVQQVVEEMAEDSIVNIRQLVEEITEGGSLEESIVNIKEFVEEITEGGLLEESIVNIKELVEDSIVNIRQLVEEITEGGSLEESNVNIKEFVEEITEGGSLEESIVNIKEFVEEVTEGGSHEDSIQHVKQTVEEGAECNSLEESNQNIKRIVEDIAECGSLGVSNQNDKPTVEERGEDRSLGDQNNQPIVEEIVEGRSFGDQNDKPTVEEIVEGRSFGDQNDKPTVEGIVEGRSLGDQNDKPTVEGIVEGRSLGDQNDKPIVEEIVEGRLLGCNNENVQSIIGGMAEGESEMAEGESAGDPNKYIMYTSDEVVEIDTSIPTYGFDLKTDKTDITLEVQGQEIYVSRVICEMISPAFKEFLSSSDDGDDTNGNNRNSNVVVTVKGKQFQDFVEFLACVYPGKPLHVTPDNVHRVLPLASEFMVDDLKDKCEAMLLQELSDADPTDKLVVQCIDYSCRYTLPVLKEKSVGKLARHRMANIELIDEPLDLDDEGKSAVYGIMMTDIRQKMSRQVFFSAGVNYRGYTEFVDAKYNMVEFTFPHVMFFGAREANFETEVWNVKVEGQLRKEKRKDTIKVEVKVVHPTLSECLIAVVLVVHNKESDKGNFRYPIKNTLPIEHVENPWVLTGQFNFDDIKYKDLGYRRKDGQYHISAHVLMNKPRFD